MADAKHTPGTWKVIKGAVEGDTMRCAVVVEQGTHAYLIATIENGAPGDFCETEEANANLVAAAPAMLAELKSLSRAYVSLMEAGRDRIVMLGGDCDPVDKMEEGDPNLRSARATIAIATGAA